MARSDAMAERGRGEGINFSYGGNISQTTNSHRLIAKARELKGEEGQLRMVERCAVVGPTSMLAHPNFVVKVVQELL